MSFSSSDYSSTLYGLLFLATSCILTIKARKLTTSPAKNIFWSLIAFSIMKSLSIIIRILSGLDFAGYDITGDIFTALYTVSCIISNVFLFHFGISALTYNTLMKLDYKIFPVLLLIGFMTLNMLGLIEFSKAEEISRYSFGFNGALLGGIGCFNIYKIKKSINGIKTMSWFITCGIALILLAFTEGIITRSTLGVRLDYLRIFSASILFISSFYFADLIKEEKKQVVKGKNKIGFV